MLKKWSALFLAFTLALTTVSACGRSEDSNRTEPSGNSSANTENTDNSTTGNVGDGEIVTIEYYGIDLSGTNDITDVAAAVNAITEQKIGVHVNFNLLDFGSYLQQVSLKMSGNERIDLMNYAPAPPATFSSMTSQNQLMDMTELLEEYAPEALEAVGEFIKGTTVNGEIYGVPTIAGFSTQLYVIMRKDILEALDLVEKAENLSSWSEYEEILQAVYDANKNGTLPEELQTICCVSNADLSGRVVPLQGIMTGSDSWSENYGVDVLGDSYNIVYADAENDQILPYYESEEYFETLERIQSWYEKGYIYKDATITEDSGDALMKNNVTFSYIATGQTGIEDIRYSTTGHEVIASQVLSIPMGSSVSQTWGMSIPITAKEPEAAAKFLNLLYSDSEIMNLLTWGIEGRDYTLNEEGEAVKEKNAVYSSNMYLWGNGFLTYPAQGQGGDYMQRLADADATAEISKYIGFSADTSQFTNELTAINNVINQYRSSLESGSSANLEQEYKQYCQAMEDAGIQKVLDAYQEQLDAWLSQNADTQ